MKNPICYSQVFVVFLLALLAPSAHAFSVKSFFPRGETSSIKTIRAEFSEAVVSAGDPSLPAPFSWDCPIKGASVWVDGQNWTLNLVDEIPLGTKCSFKIKAGLKSLKGHKFEGADSFSFEAGGLKITGSRPWTHSRIEEGQIFGFAANGKLDRSSVVKNAFIEIEGIKSKIYFSLIEGKLEKELLEKMFVWGRNEHADFIFLKPKLTLPSSAKLSVVFPKGIRADAGSLLGDDFVFPFEVRGPFTVSVNCVRENAEKRCSPFNSIRLAFSSSVKTSQLPLLKVTKKSGEIVKISISDYDKKIGEFQGFELPGPLVPNEEFKIEILGELKDSDGRKLINASSFPLKVGVEEYPPLAKFATDFGIIEFDKDAAVPVTARNLESEVPVKVASLSASSIRSNSPIKSFFRSVIGSAPDFSEVYIKTIEYFEKIESGKYGRDRYLAPTIAANERVAKVSTVNLPKVLPPKTMEVVGIPVKEPGFHVFEIASTALGSALLTPSEGKTMYVPAGYMVTNLGVHLKVGRENSIVWVTELDSGKPAKGATVSVVGCNRKIVWSAKVSEVGVAEFKGDLAKRAGHCNGRQSSNYVEGEFNSQGDPFYVFAQRKDDFSFTKSNWNSGIEMWRWPVSQPWSDSYPLIAHSMLDRTLLRAGETVHFKHFLRSMSGSGFELFKGRNYDKLEIRHSGSDDKFEVPIKWFNGGSGDSTWAIPKTAKLGYYSASLIGAKLPRIGVASFSVQEFRVPLTKAYVKVPAGDLIGVKSLPLQMGVQYLAGGGVSGVSAKLVFNHSEREHHLYSKKHEQFNFNYGAPRKDYWSDTPGPSNYETVPLTANDQGQLSHVIAVKPSEKAQTYNFELSYIDPNGETRTYGATKTIIPDTWNIGIDTSKWLLKNTEIPVKAVLLDEWSKPLAGKAIHVRFIKREYLTHRKKIAGGVYIYENQVELKDLNISCDGSTDSQGVFSCTKILPTSGAVFAEVSTKNKNGKVIKTNHEFFLPSSKDGENWFGSATDDRMDLLADKKEYEPGETASIQVRAPFKDYWALVTTEREGVLGYNVTEMHSANPVVDLKITGAHAPNVYVSVLGVRGRIAGEKPTALVDLSKPAFKLGNLNLKVGRKSNRLNVEVTPDKKVYTVRDQAQIKIKVASADGSALGAPSEIAVAVVDEGLLELKRNESWDVLNVMMSERPLAVQTFTSQMHVIGKRHFGQKAMNLGGDGGVGNASNPRELFDTLLSWQPHVPLDKNGQATVQFSLNDSLTSFKIAVVATSGTGKFGTGYASIRSNKDVILFAGMPPVVRSDDVLEVKVTARNTLPSPIKAQIKGGIAGAPNFGVNETMSLGPNETKEVTFNYKDKLQPGSYKLETSASVGDKVVDSVVSKFEVIPFVRPKVQQGQLSQITDEFKAVYAPPKDALPGLGGLRASAKRTLVSSLDGIRDFALNYPYTCYEQQFSKLIMLDDEAGFKKLIETSPSYLASNGLLKYFPSMQQGSEVLTTYILQLSHARGWKYPNDMSQKMIEGLRQFVRGKSGRASQERDDVYRRLAALDALTRYGEIAADDLEFIPKDIAAWPTSAVIDLLGVASRAKNIPNRTALIQSAENALQSRITLNGSIMGFQSEDRDVFSRLMTNGDVNAFRTILTALEFGLWKKDWGRYMSGSVGRLKKGAASLTTANAWAIVTARRFSELVESPKISGKTDIVYGTSKKLIEWSQNEPKNDAEWSWIPGENVLTARHVGSGAPWLSVQSIAAIDRNEPFFNGIRVSKKLTGLQGANPAALKVGDLVQVTLTVKTQSSLDWLVINDPVPSGASVLGKGLDGESTMGGDSDGRSSRYPSFVESGFDSVRAYYESVSDGEIVYSYKLRINNAGTFTMPVTRAEAMYAPEVFAELPNESWKVGR